MDASIRDVARRHSANWMSDISIPGPEDVVIDHAANVAYVSSQDRSDAEWVIWGLLRNRSVNWDRRGCICALDVSGLSVAPIIDHFPFNEPFHPCGIELFIKPDGTRRFFVVNWRSADTHSVEVFDLVEGELCHKHTVHCDQLACPNDIVAISENEFYVSNSYSLPRILRLTEALLRLPTGSVFFGEVLSGVLEEVSPGIAYANGLACDRARGALYVASTLGGEVVAFSWNPEAPRNRLERRAALSLNFLPDNLAWEDDSKNTLWTAGTTSWAGLQYMALLKDRAPSRVARIPLASDVNVPNPFAGAAQPVYDDNGGEIAACSVAAPFELDGECRFIAGACFDDHAILCRAMRAA